MDDTRPDPARTAPRSPADPLHNLHSLRAYRLLRRLGEGGMDSAQQLYLTGQSEPTRLDPGWHRQQATRAAETSPPRSS